MSSDPWKYWMKNWSLLVSKHVCLYENKNIWLWKIVFVQGYKMVFIYRIWIHVHGYIVVYNSMLISQETSFFTLWYSKVSFWLKHATNCLLMRPGSLTSPIFSIFHCFVKERAPAGGRISGCHCFLATALALPVHLPGWRLSEIAVFHNRLGRSGPTHNECCCNFCCHGGNGCPSSFFFFFFLPIGPCTGGNLHRDINVTVMFYTRAAMQNC